MKLKFYGLSNRILLAQRRKKPGLPLKAFAFISLIAIGGCNGSSPSVPNKAPEQLQYESGLDSLKKGDNTQAMAYFDTAIRLNPSFSPAYFSQAETAAKTGHLDLAISKLDLLAKTAPKTEHLYCRLAELRVSGGRFVDGATAVKLALDHEPNCALANTEYALILAEAGDNQRAISLLKQAQAQTEMSPRVAVTLARLEAENGEQDEAWKISDKFETANIRTAATLALRAKLFAEHGKNGKNEDQQAKKLLEEALAASPKNPIVNLEMGKLLTRSGDLNRALACLQSASDSSSQSFALPKALLEVQIKLKNPQIAKLIKSEKEYEQHIQNLLSARRNYLKTPEDRTNILKLAPLEASVGNSQDAEKLLTGLLRQDPNDPEALRLLTPQDSPIAPKKP